MDSESILLASQYFTVAAANLEHEPVKISFEGNDAIEMKSGIRLTTIPFQVNEPDHLRIEITKPILSIAFQRNTRVCYPSSCYLLVARNGLVCSSQSFAVNKVLNKWLKLRNKIQASQNPEEWFHFSLFWIQPNPSLLSNFSITMMNGWQRKTYDVYQPFNLSQIYLDVNLCRTQEDTFFLGTFYKLLGSKLEIMTRMIPFLFITCDAKRDFDTLFNLNITTNNVTRLPDWIRLKSTSKTRVLVCDQQEMFRTENDCIQRLLDISSGRLPLILRNDLAVTIAHPDSEFFMNGMIVMDFTLLQIRSLV